MTAIAAGGSLYGVGEYVAGPGHSLAVTSGGNVFAWGYNTDGELGDGGTANSDVPVKSEGARGHEGDRHRGRRITEPGGDLEGHCARLGRQQLRPAR